MAGLLQRVADGDGLAFEGQLAAAAHEDLRRALVAAARRAAAASLRFSPREPANNALH